MIHLGTILLNKTVKLQLNGNLWVYGQTGCHNWLKRCPQILWCSDYNLLQDLLFHHVCRAHTLEIAMPSRGHFIPPTMQGRYLCKMPSICCYKSFNMTSKMWSSDPENVILTRRIVVIQMLTAPYARRYLIIILLIHPMLCSQKSFNTSYKIVYIGLWHCSDI